MNKKIVLLGLPGSGKGTISEILTEKHKITHISVGDILRKNIKDKTELGKLAQEYMLNGKLLPNEIIIKLVSSRLNEEDCKDQYLLDGYPRTIKQAEALEAISKPDYVFDLVVKKEIIIDRLVGRRMCKGCSSIFNINNLKDILKCPKCNSQLYQRDDDKYEVIKKRLDVHEIETAPITKYYKNKNKLIEIDGSKHPDEIYIEIKKYLN